ncbi:uncharacterized protein LOC134540089 isoform X1 [Bacillus rossius redtenbacheri]|uniref:uncharacterized protein LOC134540089 isoform X1 n=1 Tax=Bacillus rossius redtenbacheri TaxID=93214 RepID=UPI002FDDBB55
MVWVGRAGQCFQVRLEPERPRGTLWLRPQGPDGCRGDEHDEKQLRATSVARPPAAGRAQHQDCQHGSAFPSRRHSRGHCSCGADHDVDSRLILPFIRGVCLLEVLARLTKLSEHFYEHLFPYSSGFRPISEPQYVIFSPPPKDRKRYIPKCKLPADSGARTDTFTTCSEVVTVQVIPGDGDCLFAALAHQIFRRPVGSPEHASNTAMLRAEAVAYLRARVSSFRELLLSGGGVPGRAVRQRAVRRRQDPALPGRPGEAGVLGRGGEHRRPRQPPADARRHLPRGRDHVRHQERDRRGDESCAHRIPPVQGGRRQLQPLRQRAERAARQPLVHAEISLMIAVTGLMLRQPESS